MEGPLIESDQTFVKMGQLIKGWIRFTVKRNTVDVSFSKILENSKKTFLGSCLWCDFCELSSINCSQKIKENEKFVHNHTTEVG